MSTTKFITFYSYKGGVGRTLALGNIAWAAALKGQRVVVLDFDLEAPGISSLKPFQKPIKDLIADESKFGGLFEMILDYQENQSLSSISQYYATEPIVHKDFDPGGEIYIIPAGKENQDYIEKLQAFDWDKFYHDEGGLQFFINLRDNIKDDFDNPDLVLIDSRTGLTDIGGICTILLPDRVVMLTGLNNQNLKGSKTVIDSIDSYSKLRSEEKYLAPIDVVIVASPVHSDQETDLYRERKALAKEKYNLTFDVTLPYTTVLFFEERLFIEEQGKDEDDSEALASAYRDLYGRITEAYTEKEKTIAQQEKKFQDFLKQSKFEEALDPAKKLIDFYKDDKRLSDKLIGLYMFSVRFLMLKKRDKQVLDLLQELDSLLADESVKPFITDLYEIFNDFGAVLTAVALNSELQKKKTFFDQAIEKYKQALAMNPDSEEAYHNWGSTLSQLASIEADRDRKKNLLNQAIEKYEKALVINPNLEYAYKGWGNRLAEFADIETDKDRKKTLLHQAIDKYEKALAIDPNLEQAYNGWGNVLSDFADIETDKDRKKTLLHQAIDKYKQTLAINPNLEGAFNGWGNVLSDFAGIETDKDRKKTLLHQAIDKYEKVLAINPNFEHAYNGWGNVLSDFADIETDKDRKKTLLHQAIDKYEKVLAINPNYEAAYYGWGNRLAQFADIETDKDKKKTLLDQAIDKFEKALAINPNYEYPYNDWGNVLSELADIETDADRKMTLLNQAIVKYEKAIKINPNNGPYNNYASTLCQTYHLTKNPADLKKALEMAEKAYSLNQESGVYNMACAYSLLGEQDQALVWLTRAIKIKPYTKKELLEDIDLAPLRDEPGFQKILAECKD